jgi:hypothetical protein
MANSFTESLAFAISISAGAEEPNPRNARGSYPDGAD